MSVTENPGFANPYQLILLFDESPDIDAGAAAENLKAIVGQVSVAPGAPADKYLLLNDHMLAVNDGNEPARFAISETQPVDARATSEAVLRQSFQTRHAKDLAGRAKYQITVSAENLASLPVKERQGLLGAVNRVVCGSSNAIALFAPHLGQLFDAAQFIESPEPLFAFVGVRYFHAGDKGQVMDTVGLSALGLYDLQVHFNGLEPKEVSKALWILSRYVFDDEPTIKDGDTVTGIHNDPWRVRFERPLVGPDRIVLDLNPGQNFAAGQR